MAKKGMCKVMYRLPFFCSCEMGLMVCFGYQMRLDDEIR